MGKTEELSKDIRDNIDVLVQVYAGISYKNIIEKLRERR